jgi:hypothetical protein
VGRGHAKASSRDPAPTIETRPLPLLRAGAPGLAAGGAAPLDAVTGLDPGQERTGDTRQAYRTQAKEIPPWLSNTWCCKRGRRLVRSPA